LDLEANHQVIEQETKDNFENGQEYVGIAKAPYRNLMLDKQILRTKGKLVRHNCFYHESW
jgi:hypothetical protein